MGPAMVEPVIPHQARSVQPAPPPSRRDRLRTAAQQVAPHTWIEIAVTLAVIAAEIWVFRWVVNRMPVLRSGPRWAEEKHG